MKKIACEVKKFEYANPIRVWIKDDDLYEHQPPDKNIIDLWTVEEGNGIIRDMITRGFKYLIDKKYGVYRYVPSHEILSIFTYQDKKRIDDLKHIPQVERI
jgi:hypothetical protein